MRKQIYLPLSRAGLAFGSNGWEQRVGFSNQTENNLERRPSAAGSELEPEPGAARAYKAIARGGLQRQRRARKL